MRKEEARHEKVGKHEGRFLGEPSHEVIENTGGDSRAISL
jgi:hypothetical protein